MTPLFLRKPTFEKTGSSVKLPDDPNQWGPVVLSELHKQAPVLESYPTNLVLDRVDPMKGFGFGYVEVSKPTLNPMVDQTEPLKVPVVIKDWVLQPLDLYFNGEGKGGPLTEGRVNEELTDPAIFDQTQDAPSGLDNSMRSMLQPPWENVGAQPSGMNSQIIEKTSAIHGVEGFARGFADSVLPHGIRYGRSNIRKGAVAFGAGQIAGDVIPKAVGTLAAGKVVHDYIKSKKDEEKAAGLMLKTRAKRIAANITGWDEFQDAKSHLNLSKQLKRQGLDNFAKDEMRDAVEKGVTGGAKALALGTTAGVVANKAMGKKTASLLEALMQTSVDKADVQKLASWLNTQEGRIHSHGNTAFENSCVKALSLTNSVDHYNVKTSGIQIKQYKWNGGPTILVKTAEPDSFAPQQQEVPTQEAAQELPPENQEQLQQEGETVTAPEQAVMTPEQLEQEDFQQIQSFGVYKCITVNNETVVGWVFPFTLSFDMQIVPTAIFTDGERYVLQESIAGVSLGSGTALPNNVPSGLGLFYYVKNGKVVGFGPVNVKGQQTMSDGTVAFMTENMLDGSQAMVTKVPGMVSSSVIGEGQYAIPEECRFIAFGQPVNTLVSDPGEAAMMTSPANAKLASGLLARVQVTLDGSVTLRGAPFAKLASADTTMLSKGDAVFLLACAGVDPAYSRVKIARARKTGGILDIPVMHQIEMPKLAMKKTAARQNYLKGLKVSMFKEAAALEDPMITDTILSLNFLSPENVSMFMSYIPELQEVSSKLASLTLASRLGLEDIPEAPCSSSLVNLEKVIEGLKMLQLREGSV